MTIKEYFIKNDLLYLKKNLKQGKYTYINEKKLYDFILYNDFFIFNTLLESNSYIQNVVAIKIGEDKNYNIYKNVRSTLSVDYLDIFVECYLPTFLSNKTKFDKYNKNNDLLIDIYDDEEDNYRLIIDFRNIGKSYHTEIFTVFNTNYEIKINKNNYRPIQVKNIEDDKRYFDITREYGYCSNEITLDILKCDKSIDKNFVVEIFNILNSFFDNYNKNKNKLLKKFSKK